MKGTTASKIVALGGIASSSAFVTPVGRQHIALQPSLRDHHHYPAVASQLPRGDVSVGLFGNLFKKIKGDDGGEDDEAEANKKIADALAKRSANLEADVEEKVEEKVEPAANPFFATSSDEKEEVKEEDEAVPFVTTSYLNSLEGEEEAATVEVDTTEATTIESKVDEAPAVPVEQPAAVTEPVKEKEVEQPAVVVEPVKETEVLSPLAQAKKLKAQAARIRLEADKRQVELTLEKIAKLNKKLEQLKRQDVIVEKDQQSLEEQLQMLKSQLIKDEKGEMKPVAASVKAVKKQSTATGTASSSPKKDLSVTVSRTSLSAEEMAKQVKRFQEAPEFMKVLVAKTVGFGVDDSTPGAVDRLNATDIVQKLYDDKIDYESIISKSGFANGSEEERARAIIERAYEKSADDSETPTFPKEQIEAKVKELADIPQFLKGMVNKEFNDTEIAIMLLEEEFMEKQKKGKGGFFGLFGNDDKKKGEVGRDGERIDLDDRGTFSRLFSEDGSLKEASGGQPGSDLSFMMESLYPKSTRKEDETPDKRQVDAFLNDIVTPTKAFVPTENPTLVPGGWIIRGRNACESGEELIDKLDRKFANDARLREKISFYVIKDPLPDPEQILDPLNWPEVLFVAGPDVARETAVVQRTAISAFGIATTWYGSIYPFLANPKLLDRATEGMELADAGMSSDLSWLSEMSIPLFLTFMALQVTHEAGHLAVAKSKNFEITIPTLVPSVMSGLTSSITSLKSSPKNKTDLVSFAVAGPLAGMIGSILVLCYGLVITASADAATVQSYPGLPLAILRQSSLAGGLIDLILGNGVLNVPASAEAAQALASTLIALHPLAVAGFFSLLVNALALVPAGRTDGGRISLALFGRSGSQGVTFVSLATLAILGITQSDLLLFYFAFIVFFQSELEIPMRNEVDDVAVPQVLIAGFAGFLMLLTLIPMS